MYSVHIWSIIVAAIASFAIGAIWYSPALFGREWMEHLGMTNADVANAPSSGMIWRYISQLIVSIITFTIIAFAISGLDAFGARDGASVGFIAWLGFTVPSAIGGMLWEKTPAKIALITSVCSLISYIIGGAIIGAWS